MDYKKFITKLNRILQENNLRLPLIDQNTTPSSDAVAEWAHFLEICVKSGIKLSDPRWQRVTIKQQKPVTVFDIEAPESGPAEPDFRVGLQLLLGMLEEEESER